MLSELIVNVHTIPYLTIDRGRSQHWMAAWKRSALCRKVISSMQGGGVSGG